MKQVTIHMEKFVRALKEKGYDGAFLTNSAYPGTLKESLNAHLLGCLEKNEPIPPFYLTTYAIWKGDDSPRVKCDLRISHHRDSGFQVNRFDLTYENQYGKIREMKIPVHNLSEIPLRSDCHGMVAEQKKRTLKR